MKAKRILSVASLVGLLALPLVGLAVEALPTGETGAPTVVTSGASLIVLITSIGNWVFVFLMAIAALFLVYAGFLWVTAGGSPENLKKAQTMLINAVIGVAIGLGARGIVAVIRSIIGG